MPLEITQNILKLVPICIELKWMGVRLQHPVRCAPGLFWDRYIRVKHTNSMILRFGVMYWRSA